MAIQSSLSVGGPVLVNGSYSYARIEYSPASGTTATILSPGAYRTVPFDIERSDVDNIVSLSTNRFTLNSGKYKLVYHAPRLIASSSGGADVLARFQNITTSSTVANSPTVLATDDAGAKGIQNIFTCEINIQYTTSLEVQLYVGGGNLTLGARLNNGISEQYGALEIYRFKDAETAVTIKHSRGVSGTSAIAVLQHRENTGIPGQALAPNSWTTLKLNYEDFDPENLVEVQPGNNQFVLNPGTYEIQAKIATASSKVARAVDLYNVTTASSFARFNAETSSDSAAWGTGTDASSNFYLTAYTTRITIPIQSTFNIRYMGVVSGNTPVASAPSPLQEIYHEVIIKKIKD